MERIDASQHEWQRCVCNPLAGKILLIFIANGLQVRADANLQLTAGAIEQPSLDEIF